MRTFAAFLALAAASAAARAGDLIPTDPRYGPLRVESHKVDVQVDNQIALTRVEQVFANDNPATLEAQYLFPVPRGASIIDFSMTVNGKLVRGELLEKDKARSIYEGIVQKSKDPGLLEQVGTNLFRVRVFPVLPNARQKIEMTYLERLTVDGGGCRFVYPLLCPGGAKATKADDFDFCWRLSGAVPVKDVACTTHPATVSRQADASAEVKFAGHQIDLSKDLEITYRIERAAAGMDLAAHRPRDEDGTFMLLLTPELKAPRLPKDVTFVFDTSGSMEGTRIRQAKAALKFCLSKLGPEDRFNVLSFASVVTALESEPLPATDESKARAARFVDAFDASGGTNIAGALLRALEHRPAEGRPHQIVFLTDGEPTVGETRPAEIVRMVAAANRAGIRIYTFGVGGDLNRGLLEDLAESTRGVAEFVSDQENIEEKISRLQTKIATPVITDVTIDWGQAEVSAVVPKSPGDLFAGTQLIVTGRYRKAGTFEVTLKGRAGTLPVELRQKLTFPERIDVAPGIPYFWAMRKVAALLDDVRRNGQNPEVVREIIALAKQYRIVTPYTSFLVLESEAAFDQQGIDRKGTQYKPPTPTVQAPDLRRYDRPVDPRDDPKGPTGKVFLPGRQESDHNESADGDAEAMRGQSQNVLKAESGSFRARTTGKDPGTNDLLGAGPGGGGAGRFGGKTQLTLDATLPCLIWLARHQGPDGGWSATTFDDRCTGARCGGRGGSDVEATALSVLAFLNAGYTHLSKDQVTDPVVPASTLNFGETLKKGLQWLLAHQAPDGSIGERGARFIRGHALAARGLAEAYGRTGSGALKEPAEKAIELLGIFQIRGSGWRLGSEGGDPDTVTTTFAVQALKTAEICGFALPADAMTGARSWADKILGADGRSSGTGVDTAAAVLVGMLVDKGRRDPKLMVGTSLLIERLPDAASPDPLYWHVATAAICLSDGPSGAWRQKWNSPLKAAIVASEKVSRDGCASGSWDPGTFDGGRVGLTALHALTLETCSSMAPTSGVQQGK